MTTAQSDSSAIDRSGPPCSRASLAHLSLPSWVGAALHSTDGGLPRQSQQTIEGVMVSVQDAGTLALCSATIKDTLGMSAARLRSAVEHAYSAIFQAAENTAARHRVRMWSFIPDIHALCEHGLTTYHVFNQGRFNAFVRTLGSDLAFTGRLPTATGIGHDGSGLAIHCLNAHAPGVHIENPRQVPAYRYSSAYGPRPPCFARGTILTLPDRRLLLVGGTASVRDEVSMHADDIGSQLDETFENLCALALEAQPTADDKAGKFHLRRNGKPCALFSTTASVAKFTSLRVYFSDPSSEQMLREDVRDRIGPGTEIELVAARLCREELLVEIEGVMELRTPAEGA